MIDYSGSWCVCSKSPSRKKISVCQGKFVMHWW